MKLTQSLRMNYEFSRVYHKGRYLAGRYVVLHYLKRPGRSNRLGVTASRRIKGSVLRNRIKRLLRESYRQIEDQLSQGFDLILVGRETPEPPDYHAICQELERLLTRSGICQPNQKAGMQKRADEISETQSECTAQSTKE